MYKDCKLIQRNVERIKPVAEEDLINGGRYCTGLWTESVDPMYVG